MVQFAGEFVNKGELSNSPLDADYLDEVFEASEVLGIASVKREPICVGSGSDEQVRDAATVGAAGVGNSGDHLAITPSSSDIEGDRVEGRFDLLEARLATGALGACRSETGPRGQFSQCDCADRSFVRERSCDVTVVPINDH
jgi:hypothetical protein